MEQELVWQEVHCVTRTSTATTRFEAVAISLELSQRCRLFPRNPRSGGRGGRSRRTRKAESRGHCHQIGERSGGWRSAAPHCGSHEVEPRAAAFAHNRPIARSFVRI